MSLVSWIIDKVEFLFMDRLIVKWLPYPTVISIEPANICNLKCPLCPTGAQKLSYHPMTMSLDTFKLIVARMPFVRAIDLFKAGEPFLNRNIFQMIRHAKERGIDVVISTNFSFPRQDEFFDEIVASGLGRLVVSLDGTSQESYAKYRIGGSYDQVVANIEKLIAAKERGGCCTPEIVWQFLVNKFNEHEIATAQALCGDLKIALDIQPLDISDNVPDVELEHSIEERKAYWLGKNTDYVIDRYRRGVRYPLYPGICPQLFTRAVVTVDAKVLPCCEVWNEESTFGDLKIHSFRDIWFNRKYIDSRRRFFSKELRPEGSTVCFNCMNYGTTPSFRDKADLLIAIFRSRFGHWKSSLKGFHAFRLFNFR